MNGLDHWSFYDVGGRATLWFPAPEWAHQLIDRLASAWTEYPWTTEVFLVLPWFFQCDWGRVSKHVIERGTYAAGLIPDYAGATDIPCVLLHLPCYVCSLPPPQSPSWPVWIEGMEWHWDQADFVQGLT